MTSDAWRNGIRNRLDSKIDEALAEVTRIENLLTPAGVIERLFLRPRLRAASGRLYRALGLRQTVFYRDYPRN
jgi:hypothetical protein